MLLLIDLDNTLIDRAAAYKAWSHARFGPDEVPWLVEADRGGYEPREQLAAAIAARYGLDPAETLSDLRTGLIENLTFDPRVGEALTRAAAAGHVPVLVSNGTVAQQEAKLRRTGLDRLLAAWTISEAAGVKKPDRRIFELAAASVGHELSGWMVGDHPEFDIRGGAAAGLRTAWVANGRTWPLPGHRPTITAPDCATALTRLLEV